MNIIFTYDFRNIIIMFFSFIAILSVITPTILACDNNAHPNGIKYRAEGDCNSYYTCDNGVENLHSCDSEQVFNPLYRLCDWPENVPECTCYPYETPSVNTVDCSTYLQCWEIVPCLDNKVFDIRYNHCSSEVDVPNCGTSINGEWSEWSEYDECSVECGGGLKTRTRACDDPVPEFGGLDCVGNSIETQTCNTFNCIYVTQTTTETVTETQTTTETVTETQTTTETVTETQTTTETVTETQTTTETVTETYCPEPVETCYTLTFDDLPLGPLSDLYNGFYFWPKVPVSNGNIGGSSPNIISTGGFSIDLRGQKFNLKSIRVKSNSNFDRIKIEGVNKWNPNQQDIRATYSVTYLLRNQASYVLNLDEYIDVYDVKFSADNFVYVDDIVYCIEN